MSVSRESTFLRYTANTEALEELLQFLYAECCTRNRAIKPPEYRPTLQVRSPLMAATDIKTVVKEKYGAGGSSREKRRQFVLRSHGRE